jgi:tryptophanase
MISAVGLVATRVDTKVSIRLVLVSYRAEQFTSAQVKRVVFGSGGHSVVDRTLDRAGAVRA